MSRSLRIARLALALAIGLVPGRLPAEIPAHASQMFAKNLLTFLDHLIDDEGTLQIDVEDEITAGTLVARGGQVVHPMLLEKLGQ